MLRKLAGLWNSFPKTTVFHFILAPSPKFMARNVGAYNHRMTTVKGNNGKVANRNGTFQALHFLARMIATFLELVFLVSRVPDPKVDNSVLLLVELQNHSTLTVNYRNTLRFYSIGLDNRLRSLVPYSKGFKLIARFLYPVLVADNRLDWSIAIAKCLRT